MVLYTKEQISKIKTIHINGDKYFAVPKTDEAPDVKLLNSIIKKNVLKTDKVKDMILKYYKEHREDAIKAVEPVVVLYLQYKRLAEEMNSSEVKKNSKFLHSFGSLENKSIDDLEDVAQFKEARQKLNMDSYIELSKRVTVLKRELNKEMKRLRNNTIISFLITDYNAPFDNEALMTMHHTLFNDEAFINAVDMNRAYTILRSKAYNKTKDEEKLTTYSKYYDLIKEEI